MKKNNLPLLQRISENSKNFSPKQLLLAQYLEKNYKSLAYIRMTELARLANVSETTVVRFVSQLGYKGFPDFLSALRLAIESSYPQEKTLKRYDFEPQEYQFPRDCVKAIFTVEMQVLDETLSTIDMKEHQKAVDLIYTASAVIVLGCGANSCCSQAAAFPLQAIRPNVYIVEKFGLSEGALIRSLPEGSVCLAFTTPRYPKETQEIINALVEKRVKIIGVSDSILSPIASYCEVFFQIPIKYVTFIDTNAALMALIHSLAFSLQMKDKKKIKQAINEYNDFTRNQGFYINDQLDLVDF